VTRRYWLLLALAVLAWLAILYDAAHAQVLCLSPSGIDDATLPPQADRYVGGTAAALAEFLAREALPLVGVRIVLPETPYTVVAIVGLDAVQLVTIKHVACFWPELPLGLYERGRRLVAGVEG
jgi:hypothetical protein